MKAFFPLLLFLAGSLAIHAQENPYAVRSIPAKLPFPSDSLMRWQSRLHLPAIHPDMHYFDWGTRMVDFPRWNIDLDRFARSAYSRLVIPSALIAYGALAKENESLKHIDYKIKAKVDKHVSRRYHFDDYLLYASTAAVYGFHLMGVPSKNNCLDQTFVLLSAHLLTDFTVGKLKRLTDVERPDGGTRSFPSSHTSVAFVGAHVLFREYYAASPWIGLSGYLAAATTGAMRIVNNRHWFSDVLAGAGIALLSVEISYQLLPIFQKLTGRGKNSTLAIAPIAGNNIYGLGLAYVF